MSNSSENPGAKVHEAMRAITEGLRAAAESESFARRLAALAAIGEAAKVRR